ncbi:hypothetical protein L7F22_009501 [Adiantum nelumboides]|nr:hypothetical protein [Adiantum nelumboides]
MSLLSSRRRKLLFVAAVLAGSGFASYRLYRSAAFAQRRKRLGQILSALGFCCEAVSQSAEALSILSGDLKSFLLSDDDTVPQSWKQAFKIGLSEEFEESATVLSVALAHGLRWGINAKPREEGLMHGHGHAQFAKQGWQGSDIGFGSEDVACRELREVSLTTKVQEQSRMHGRKECMSRPRAETGGYDCQDWEAKNYTYGSDMHVQRSQRVGILIDRLKREKSSKDLLEKLVTRLFSEPGVGFFSAVTGSFARNFVLAFFDVSCNQTSSGKHRGSFSSSNAQHTMFQTGEESISPYAKVIDVLHSDPCKTLAAECMQTFISTAVTVYVDKTKGVNFCDDMVAGITSPSHKDSMKEMLTTICNGAIETLVRTSYDVLRDRQAGVIDEQARRSKQDARECSSSMAMNGQLTCSTKVDQEEVEYRQLEAISSYGLSDSQASSCAISTGILQGKNIRGAQSFIEAVSETLAISSNHKLIVDVAGTMTSEAVRSLMNVVVSTAKSHLNSKLHGSWGRLRNYVPNHRGQRLQERSRDMAAKAFIFASICLAVSLHILTGSHVLQT